MARVKIYNEMPQANGVQLVKCDEWQNFLSYIEREQWNKHHLYWRGQAELDWDLTPSLWRNLEKFDTGRLLKRTRHKDGDESADAAVLIAAAHDIRAAHWGAAKQALRRQLTPFTELYNRMDDDAVLAAFSQHHGTPSPLLDWTRSPFVAAFFAFADVLNTYGDKYKAKRCVAIWGLRNYVFDGIHEDHKKHTDPLERVEFQVHNEGFPLNRRMIAQQGLFTSTYPMRDLKEVANWSTSKEPALTKVTIPHRETARALTLLNRMNINYATLFPDYHGACLYAAMAAVISEYDDVTYDTTSKMP